MTASQAELPSVGASLVRLDIASAAMALQLAFDRRFGASSSWATNPRPKTLSRDQRSTLAEACHWIALTALAAAIGVVFVVDLLTGGSLDGPLWDLLIALAVAPAVLAIGASASFLASSAVLRDCHVSVTQREARVILRRYQWVFALPIGLAIYSYIFLSAVQ